MRYSPALILSAMLCCALSLPLPATAAKADPPEIPVKGMVTLVDLGAATCIPCKMMAPIIEELKEEYKGRAAVEFIDVHQDTTASERFRIMAIPSQIFYDRHGKEVTRHMGFMDKKAIKAQLDTLLKAE